jgi:hypothetical protein
MADKAVVTRVLDLSSLTPPPLSEQEDRAGVRVRYLAWNNGTGLQIGRACYQARHACGEWAWAHSAYCQHCGEPVELADDVKALVFPDPDKRPETAPPLPRPPQGPLGSFNNPAPAPRPPDMPRRDFNHDPVAAATAQAILNGARRGGMVTATPPLAPEGPARAPGGVQAAQPPATPPEAPQGPPEAPETDEDEGDGWDEELDRILDEED